MTELVAIDVLGVNRAARPHRYYAAQAAIDYINETAHGDPQTAPEPVQTAVAMTGSPVAQPPRQPAATVEPAKDGSAATQSFTSADVGTRTTGAENEEVGATSLVQLAANGAGGPPSIPASAPADQRDNQTEFSASPTRPGGIRSVAAHLLSGASCAGARGGANGKSSASI